MPPASWPSWSPDTSAARWNDYLTVGNVKEVGEYFADVAPQAVTMRYFRTDRLGSVAAVTSGGTFAAKSLVIL